MNNRYHGGQDEPTVVGHRPIGPTTHWPRQPEKRSGEADAIGLGTAMRRADQGTIDDEFFNDALVQKLGPEISLGSSASQSSEDPEDALVTAATPLLIVSGQLRGSLQNGDVDALRREMVDQINLFDANAIRLGAKTGDIAAARYSLCAFVDEVVMTTPWGTSSSWSTNSLLLQFHNETWGGEKVFTIIERVKAEPKKYLGLLKLLDLCILFGFEGKYRVINNGRQQLTDIRTELGRLIQQYGRSPPRSLSKPLDRQGEFKRLQSYVPLWIVFAIVAALLLVSFASIKALVLSDLHPALDALDAIAPIK